MAKVRLRDQMGDLLFFTSKVSTHYSLHIRGAGTETSDAHVILSRSSSGEQRSWMWGDTDYRSGLSATAATQMRALFARPIPKCPRAGEFWR